MNGSSPWEVMTRSFKAAVFLDRDGTLNVERHYLHKPDELELIDGVIEGLQLLIWLLRTKKTCSMRAC